MDVFIGILIPYFLMIFGLGSYFTKKKRLRMKKVENKQKYLNFFDRTALVFFISYVIYLKDIFLPLLIDGKMSQSVFNLVNTAEISNVFFLGLIYPIWYMIFSVKLAKYHYLKKKIEKTHIRTQARFYMLFFTLCNPFYPQLYKIIVK